MLSANMENQHKMPTSEEYVHGDNMGKTQRRSPKRPCEPEELANETMNHKVDFPVSHKEEGCWGKIPFPMVVGDLTAI